MFPAIVAYADPLNLVVIGEGKDVFDASIHSRRVGSDGNQIFDTGFENGHVISLWRQVSVFTDPRPACLWRRQDGVLQKALETPPIRSLDKEH